ncbi:unnamed protein product [Paramecium pentaurelia]|uniref:Uncharacterized protein n=1 Tax=Paramecium pentaurelia TaxID=43138 RepID=A0A8S1WGE6_9CILI|nr:unnamed protein product [Paramecium pentaurelia]
MFFPEQEYKTSTKSEDELKKLTLEEDLSECQRSYHILTKGQQLQKRAIYQNLHRILKEPNAFEILFKVIVEEIQQQEEENQIIAAKSLHKLIKDNELQVMELLQIYDLTTQILKIWSLPVLNEWIHTMNALLRVISLNIILNPTQQLILLLTDASQPTISRQSAAKLIGTLAQLLGNEIKGPLLDRARNLCSDHDKEIRLIMAEDVIVKVCQSISSDLIECYLLEKIMELYYDTDIIVKSSGMRLFYTIANQLSIDEIKNRCTKLFIDQIQSQSEESKVVMSKVCGRIYMLVKDNLNINQISLFLNIYVSYAKSKNLDVRINFISNFPAILSLTLKKFEFFQDQYMLCCNDTNETLQRTLLSSFHEVVLLSENTDILIQVFINFMKSKYQTVLQLLIFRFDSIVNSFQKQQQPRFGQPAIELLNNLIVKNQWDLQIDLLSKFSECQQIFPDINIFLNTMITTINKGIPKTKQLCCLNIAKYLSNLENLRKRKDWIIQLFELYFKSDSYFNRIIFIDIVQEFTQFISRKLFKQYQFYDILIFSKDPILNVRMRLIKILPILYKKIDSEDASTLNMFNDALQDCILSGSRSFQYMIQQTKQELLKPSDESYLNQKDQEMLEKEEQIYKNDQKQRQLLLDQERDDLEINKIDLNDYLTKYKKKYPLTKIKITTPNMHSQTMLIKKPQLQNNATQAALLVKKSVDFDSNKSPLLEAASTLKKPVLKSKTPTTKSICDIKKQFKLPSIKK